MYDARTLGILAALGSAASWALGTVLFARLSIHLNPVALTLSKGVVGLALLGLALLASGPVVLSPQGLPLLIGSGLLGIAIGDALFFAALKRLGASTVVLLFTIGQASTLILSVWWLGERPSLAQWIGIAVITLGVTAVLWLRREPESSKTQSAGILYGLGSVISMSVSVILAKEALAVTGALEGTFIRMFAAVLGIGLWALATKQLGSGLAPILDASLLRRFAVAVTVVTFGGFWLSLVAVKNIEVSIANTLSSTEAVFVLPIARTVLREKITAPLVLCALATAVGVALLSFGP